MSVGSCVSWAQDTTKECRGWTKWVCLVWTWTTTVVCVVWALIAVLLVPVAWPISLMLAVPIVGRLIREIWSLALEVFWRAVGLPDALLELFGLRLQKKMRVSVVILSDKSRTALATEASLHPSLTAAKAVFESEARVSVILTGISVVSEPAPPANLDVKCGATALADDFRRVGSHFELRAAMSHPLGCAGRLVGYGAAIVVFVTRDVSGTDIGCSLGPLSDYVIVEGPAGDCIHHELAHACGLWHVDTANNLANPACGGNKLKKWQSMIVRNSRHVTYI